MVYRFHKEKFLPPYVFAGIGALKKARLESGFEVFDFSMGNPDLPPSSTAVARLHREIDESGRHRYSSSEGEQALRNAAARYYGDRFGVSISAEREVCVTLGSKEGLSTFAQATVSPGDVVLAPDPCYPIHKFGYLLAGANVISLAFKQPEDILRGAEEACRRSVPSPVAIVVNFPSNPTGATAGTEFYRDLVKLARRNDLLIVSDLAYSEIYFDGPPPTSVFEIEGARDIAIEFTSMSKTFSMPGWRIGFGVGSERLISVLKRIKSYLDYGAFAPLQLAAAASLTDGGDEIDCLRETYRSRRNALVESFATSGFDIPPPPATMFAWSPIPSRLRAMGSVAFAEALLDQTGVAVTPGVGFGASGEGYVRFALIEPEDRIRAAAARVADFIREAAPS